MDPASPTAICVGCSTPTPRAEMFGHGADLRCPSCAEAIRERLHPSQVRRSPAMFRPVSTEPRVTGTVLGLIAVVWVGLQVSALRPHFLSLIGLIDAPGFADRFYIMAIEVWHPVARAVSHVALWHLVMNGLALFQIGRWIELGWGGRVLAFTLLGSAIFGTTAAWLVNAQPAIGLSGGIFGIDGWLLALRRHHAVATAIVNRVFLHSLVAGTLLLVVLTEVGGMPISHVGHAAGFLWGYLAGLAARRAKPLPLFLLLAAATVALLVATPHLEPLGWRTSLFGRA